MFYYTFLIEKVLKFLYLAKTGIKIRPLKNPYTQLIIRVMEPNILMKYMEQRFKKNVVDGKKKIKESGPVITISRETGCPAKRIAKHLTLILNKKRVKKDHHWKCISKEILKEAAKELDLEPSKIKYVFDFEQRSTWDEILHSLTTKYYKSDRKIRKTISDVIRTIATTGYVIIIGRGSVAITHDIPKSIHINLEAPLEWRAEMLCEKMHVKIEEAKKYALETDKKREQFRNSFYGKNTDYTRFDITFNCMKLSDEEIVNSIVKILEMRGLI